jgi:RNA polymerase sigma-70 factor (ECF subfamily)
VARAVVAWARRVTRLPGVSLRPAEINGDPGVLLLDGEQRVIGVTVLDVSNGEVTAINGIVNPDKLVHLGPVGDFKSLLRSSG